MAIRLNENRSSYPMRKTRAILLSITDFSDSKNGGGLWTANLLETMALVPNMEFIVVLAGPESIRSANEAFVRSLGLDYLFLPFRPIPTRAGTPKSRRIANATGKFLDMLVEKYYFSWERESVRQKHIDVAFRQIIEDKKPDLIIINYLFSALFVPSIFKAKTPRSLISLNNEAAFHRALKSHGGPVGDKLHQRGARWIYQHFNWIPDLRVRSFEKRISTNCTGLVTLTRSDLPDGFSDHVMHAVLPPIFKPRALKWDYRGSRRVFFVGNVGYYPNRLAIEWICRQLAPELSQLDDQIRINIIGASRDQVPVGWHSANVSFMGYADAGEVIYQMITADVFVAPIANTFGAKIKLAECVAHGTPFLATQAALSGLPFLDSVPIIDLDRPGAAARLLVEYLDNPDALVKLSQSNSERAQRARAEQTSAWGSFFKRCMEIPAGQ
jgi:hypothetical protein